MNWSQLKDPFCYLCLAGAVLVSWSYIIEVEGLNNPFKA